MDFLLTHPHTGLGTVPGPLHVSFVKLFAEVAHQGQLRPRVFVEAIELAVDASNVCSFRPYAIIDGQGKLEQVLALGL